MSIFSLAYLFLFPAACKGQASDLDGFSNNLATDIGPLIALFGDGITKQYLSESTTFLDYIIFSLAPIGIATTIVSAIRVCGGSALRAFIGRAQEGEGAIEAELCTSTSRDVCELFNKGGITRVLGQPQILEVIYLPHDPDLKKTEGLHLFRDYLQDRVADCRSQETMRTKENPGDWVPVGDGIFVVRLKSVFSELHNFNRKVSRYIYRKAQPAEQHVESASSINKPNDKEEDKSSTSEPFSHSPNLSINVGIVKRSSACFYAVTVIGLILQGGVVVVAGTVSWKLQWTHDGAPDELTDSINVSTYREPMAFILGTISLCVGTFWCAALVGQITDELHFRRDDSKLGSKSQLFYLQPGNQVIGDQTFDAFAYFEDLKRPLVEYTTSWKAPRGIYIMSTWSAILLSLGGYIAQFVGLRGMSAWVSIAQLATTVLMSLLRGALRMQRLDSDLNQLIKERDKVVGHELDWLAFELVKKWGTYTPGLRFSCSFVNNPPMDPSSINQGLTIEKLVRGRYRLARLTGHGTAGLKRWSYQNWPDEMVKVRSKARLLAKALCATAEALIPDETWLPDRGEYLSKFKDEGSITIRTRVKVAIWCPDRYDYTQQFVEIPIKRPIQENWSINSAKLETLLGLWLWSTIVADASRDRSDYNSGSDMHQVDRCGMMRILSACVNGGQETYNLEKMLRQELRIWGADSSIHVNQSELELSQIPVHDSTTIWSGRNWLSLSPRPGRANYRFFGWMNVPDSILYEVDTSWKPSLESHDQKKARDKISVQYAWTRDTRNPDILAEYARDLYAIIVNSMIRQVKTNLGEIVPKPVPGGIRLSNTKIDASIAAFIENGLGSRSDALVTIMPILRPYMNPLPAQGEAVIPTLLDMTAKCRDIESDNDIYSYNVDLAVESVLQWVCNWYIGILRKGGSPDWGDNTPNKGGDHELSSAIIALGEFYRRSLRQNIRFSDNLEWFGHLGLLDSLENLEEYVNGITLISRSVDAINRYKKVIKTIEDDKRKMKTPSLGESHHRQKLNELFKNIQTGKIVKALSCLCFISVTDIKSETRPFLACAAQQGWSEVVIDLLDSRASPDVLDGGKRSALSYFAEVGNTAMAKVLLNKHANPNESDRHGRTPLWWAAGSGQPETIKLLLNAEVDADCPDNDCCTPLSNAAKKGHIDIIKLLLNAGADADHADNKQRTPLSYAAEKGYVDVVEILLNDKSIRVDLADKDKITPFAWAVQNGYENIVRLLIEKGGFDIHKKDNEGMSPHEWAKQNGYFNRLPRGIE
ncbi:hypothetical protein F5Y04DRAFT_287299 [Hypomontagnella monticulosa]|nr:hypothetical protein F5Y04DRAFT_287299 [Hypomontagnella monticulosa]